MIYTEQHRELMRSVTKFVESEINPHAEEWERDGIFPAHDVFKKMGKQGFLGINKPEKFGGLGRLALQHWRLPIPIVRSIGIHLGFQVLD